MNNRHTASNAQIGEAVRIRAESTLRSVRAECNKIICSQDPYGGGNQYTTKNNGPSRAAQTFINRFK